MATMRMSGAVTKPGVASRGVSGAVAALGSLAVVFVGMLAVAVLMADR